MKTEIVHELYNGPDNPRNSEGSFVNLADGRIMYVYTRYRGNHWEDHCPADLVAIFSNDGGRTWDKDYKVVVPNEGKCNVMSVSMLRLQDGRIALFYIRKNSSIDERLWMRTSSNEGKSWSKPTCCIHSMGYYVINNDRVIQLKNGRLIIPASLHRNKIAPSKNASIEMIEEMDGRGIAVFFCSDDAGKTWRELPDWWALPVRSTMGLQETGMIELKRGKLYAWARTSTGCQWEMHGRKSGDVIDAPQPSVFKMRPTSPMSMKRIPQTGDLLAIWCDAGRRWKNARRDKAIVKHSATNWNRTPLGCAISSDEGKTWKHHKLIETDPKRGFCYTAIHFTDDAVLLSYCCGGEYPDGHKSVVLQDTCIRRIELDWFYN